MQWLQDQNKSNVDCLDNVRHEASRHFRARSRIISKLKLMNLKLTVIKNALALYRGISDL